MSEARTGERVRETRETRIAVSENLDGTGEATIATGVGFYDHLLSSCLLYTYDAADDASSV